MKKPKLKFETINCPECRAKVDIDYGCCGRQWCSVCGTAIFIDYDENGAIEKITHDTCGVWDWFGEIFEEEEKSENEKKHVPKTKGGENS